MKRNVKYIRKEEFHKSDDFLKINRHIDTSLHLIQRLMDFNRQCLKEVDSALQVNKYIIDFRVDQFTHYHETLSALYYNCYSLKYVYDISAMMNFKKFDTTIGIALNSQTSYITFTGIVKMAGIFEFTRKKFEQEIKGEKYYSKVSEKYPKLGDSLQLLMDFRNTIHSNGHWGKKLPLEYKLQSRKVSIKEGEKILVEIWLLYKLIRDCIELGKLMALDNKPVFLRDTRLVSGGDRVVVLQRDKESVEKIFNSSNEPQ
ncbi:MAG: hypothetical protein IPL84_18455 [Chitinophagaceae bacterium]|nr:hypothetical protein [Chitinophagaceae bacterium]